MKTFLVASPGRTGSSFLTSYIKKLSEQFYPVSVVQTHNGMEQLPRNTVAIACRRRDLWSHTLSSVIAEKRDEWVKYTECNESFTIDLDKFENKYVWNLRWFDAFEYYTSYDTRINLYYEDFMQDHMLINRCLGLPEIPVETTTRPSPDLKNKIQNLEELKLLFDKLESNEYLHTFPIHERCWEWVRL